MSRALTLSTFDAPARAGNLTLGVPAPEGGWTWPPTSVTLIAGEREAVLVDTLPTVVDSRRLADWIAASGRELATIYLTHAHLDHYLGTAALLERFPGARVVATGDTARLIAEEARTGKDRGTFGPLFADEIGAVVVVPEVLGGHRIDLEGHELRAVAAGPSEISHSSFLHVPELAAVIVGDIAYDEVHLPLYDSDPGSRRRWIRTIRDVQAVDPEIVVAAHRRAGARTGATVLQKTIDYLEEADRLLADGPTASGFTARMRSAHPTRLNLTTLIFSAALLGLEG
ncbi:MBL fold metallo-hydrolase [Actinoplanes sp. NBRC 14428]|nr:MBL fold metallo-hydrolase [Actinoplanes sp. NBRC 14428]